MNLKGSLYVKTAIISSIIVVSLFLITSFLFFIGYQDIPLGILLGGSVSSLSMYIFSIKENSPDHKFVIRLTIFFIILMSILHAGALILAGTLYYVANLHIFNLFSTFGALFIGLIVLVILNLKQKKGE